MKNKKILIVKLSAIGDVVMALPMIEAAKKKYGEDVEITWVCGKMASIIIKTFFEDVKVIEVDEKKLLKGSFFIKIIEVIKLWLKIAFRKFDLVATAHSDIRYRLLTLPVIAKIKHHWGVTNGRKHPVPGRYHGIEAVWLITGDDDYKLEEYLNLFYKLKIGDEWCVVGDGCNCRQNTIEYALKPSLEGGNKREGDLTSENFNSLEQISSKADNKNTFCKHKDWITTTSAKPRNDDSRKKVVLVPGGAKNALADNPCRRWGLNKYLELAQKLLEKDYEVIIVGSNSDKWVVDAFKEVLVTNLIGKTNLIELLIVLNQSDFVVTHDTGTLHLAQLTNTKIIALFGPTNPYEKVQKSNSSKIIWKPDQLSCCPCYDGKTYAECKNNRCMERITVQEVLREIER